LENATTLLLVSQQNLKCVQALAGQKSECYNPIYYPVPKIPIGRMHMQISAAQRELRLAFMGGFIAQLIEGGIWAISAAVSLWTAPIYGMVVLFIASAFLYPLTQLVLRLIGHKTALSQGNTLDQLATQLAFTVPVGFLLVIATTLYRENWFYPASMIVVGAHYIPFVFLYGMRVFGALAILMVAAGAGIGLYGPDIFSLGGWVAAVLLIGFAFVGRGVYLREVRRGQASAGLEQ
jgi:hypothetical protein